MTDYWANMLNRQERLQTDRYERVSPRELRDDRRKRFVLASAFGLVTEIGEASAHVDWKPWENRVDRIEDDRQRDMYMIELIDALHFWFNLALVARRPDQSIETFAFELFATFVDKNARNVKRQDDGYDGSTKCGSCAHALDDGSEYLGPVDEIKPLYEYRCNSCAAVNVLETKL